MRSKIVLYVQTDEGNYFNSCSVGMRTLVRIKVLSWEGFGDCRQRAECSEGVSVLAKTVGCTRITPKRQILYSFKLTCCKVTHFLCVCFNTFKWTACLPTQRQVHLALRCQVALTDEK